MTLLGLALLAGRIDEVSFAAPTADDLPDFRIFPVTEETPAYEARFDEWLVQHPGGEPLPPGSYAILDTGALAGVAGFSAGEEQFSQLSKQQKEQTEVSQSPATFCGITPQIQAFQARVHWDIGMEGHSCRTKLDLPMNQLLP